MISFPSIDLGGACSKVKSDISLISPQIGQQYSFWPVSFEQLWHPCSYNLFFLTSFPLAIPSSFFQGKSFAHRGMMEVVFEIVKGGENCKAPPNTPPPTQQASLDDFNFSNLLKYWEKMVAPP